MAKEHERKQWREMLRKSFHPAQWYERDWDKETVTENKTMYVYRPADAGFVVGFYTPQGEWIGDSEHETRQSAADRVHWLNGGNSLAVVPMVAHEVI